MENMNLFYKNIKRIFAYTRANKKDKCMIVTNLFATETEFEFPIALRNDGYQIILCNYKLEKENNNQKHKLRPFEARVYKFENK